MTTLDLLMKRIISHIVLHFKLLEETLDGPLLVKNLFYVITVEWNLVGCAWNPLLSFSNVPVQ